jgi:hypothetical protein
MTAMEKFRDYAEDFERTFHDDDWSRLRMHFADDAVYEVRSTTFGCRLVGPEAIFRGIKKSLDGFDRRFSGREIGIISVRDATDEGLEVAWEVAYTKQDDPPFRLRGRTRVTYENGLIVALADIYDEAMDREAADWLKKHAPDFDLSYV